MHLTLKREATKPPAKNLLKQQAKNIRRSSIAPRRGRRLRETLDAMTGDSVSAYEKHAREFLNARDRSTIGAGVVERWARSLSPCIEVLEIGCGGGLPVTRVLADAGLKLWAVDSSPTLLSEFRTRFPNIPVECAQALESTYFRRP